MILKKKLIISILLLTTIILSIINFKNTSKTYLYFLNLKTDKLTLGNSITLSFLVGLTSTITFSYVLGSKNENSVLSDEKSDINKEISQQDFLENNDEVNVSVNGRPPERDIRDSQPTISVNYRVVKKNKMEINDADDGYTTYNKNQNNDDWEEIESNW